MKYYLEAFKKYAEFSGRAGRKEYWMFVLFNIIFFVVINMIDTALETTILSGIYSLAIMIPSLAACTRRLHDIGKSGWMILVSLIPLVGWIWIIVLLATKGDEKENQYGPVPADIE
ncbi:MAG TPA: DUF805 domain-containing protein [Candidatus Woesebacteria bacterium]|nr:DUF805 domain-containing protein [Candidatus Woesebacteria bacterium]